MTDLRRNVKVELGERSYSITIGYGVLEQCVSRLSNTCVEKDIFLISDSNVYDIYGQDLMRLLQKEDYRVFTYIMPAGEEAKSWEQAGRILTKMLEANLSRNACVLALGGGVVGDMAGFTAALYRRGIRFFQIPTSLLAQVDSSVGGKVAVNHPLGKNMIGTFYQPQEVWADLQTLDTLSCEEWRAGLAEVVKYGLIWDLEFYDFLENNAEKILQRSPDVMPDIIERCCQIKAEVVSCDERDEGLRNILNFGHTIGHALESATFYKKYRHGEAVAIGMMGAFRLAQDMGMIDEEKVERLRNLLIKLELPYSFSGSILETAVNNLIYDKKVSQQQLVFVLPIKFGEVVIKKGIAPEQAKRSMQKLLAE